MNPYNLNLITSPIEIVKDAVHGLYVQLADDERNKVIQNRHYRPMHILRKGIAASYRSIGLFEDVETAVVACTANKKV